jgi:hypothetical protein
MPRRPREFPVEVPEYIQEFCEVRLRMERPPEGVWIMRSEYERRQALRLIAEGIPFLYEDQSLEYVAKVHNGICLDCNSEAVGSVRSYTPDFFFPLTNVFAETKGKFDSQNRTKMKEVCGQSSDDIRMVFMRDNWLTKRRKMNYSRWCTLNDIPFAIGDIPLEWTT